MACWASSYQLLVFVGTYLLILKPVFACWLFLIAFASLVLDLFTASPWFLGFVFALYFCGPRFYHLVHTFYTFQSVFPEDRYIWNTFALELEDHDELAFAASNVYPYFKTIIRSQRIACSHSVSSAQPCCLLHWCISKCFLWELPNCSGILVCYTHLGSDWVDLAHLIDACLLSSKNVRDILLRPF